MTLSQNLPTKNRSDGTSPAAREAAAREFATAHGWADCQWQPLAQDASRRRYFRLIKPGGNTRLIMDAPPPGERVIPFIAIANWLRGEGLPAPQIYVADHASGLLLLEDFGSYDVARVLAEQNGDESTIYRSLVHTLVMLQRALPPAALPVGGGNKPYALPDYTLSEFTREYRLFIEWYLPEVSLDTQRNAAALDELEGLMARLLTPFTDATAGVMVHRDYHSENLMWRAETKSPGNSVSSVGLIDFQDGLTGPCGYDLMSLVTDCRRRVSPPVWKMVIETYANETERTTSDVERQVAILGAQRTLKILGIFVRLYRRDQKPGYLAYLPYLWELWDQLLEHEALHPLKTWSEKYLPNDLRLPPALHGQPKSRRKTT
ncbi:MAG: phosphotransferase [Pseudomonadota bacterium]